MVESTIGQGDGLSFEVREIRGHSITTLKRRGRYVVSRNSTLGHLKKGMKIPLDRVRWSKFGKLWSN